MERFDVPHAFGPNFRFEKFNGRIRASYMLVPSQLWAMIHHIDVKCLGVLG